MLLIIKKQIILVLKLKPCLRVLIYILIMLGDFLEAAIFRMKNYGKNLLFVENFTNEFKYAPSRIKKYGPCISKKINNKRLLIFDHEDDTNNFQSDMIKRLKEIVTKETIYEGSEKFLLTYLNGKN